MNKYHAVKTVVNGIKFDSKAEAKRYGELWLLQRAGQIRDLQLQVRFELLPKCGDERAVYYVADFKYTENGREIVEDVKGTKTRDYILKRKMFKYRYPEIIFVETY